MKHEYVKAAWVLRCAIHSAMRNFWRNRKILLGSSNLLPNRQYTNTHHHLLAKPSDKKYEWFCWHCHFHCHCHCYRHWIYSYSLWVQKWIISTLTLVGADTNCWLYIRVSASISRGFYLYANTYHFRIVFVQYIHNKLNNP